jgi:hypothetical protein
MRSKEDVHGTKGQNTCFTKLNTNQSPYHHPIPQILPSSLPLPSSQQVQSLQLLQQQELKEIHKA